MRSTHLTLILFLLAVVAQAQPSKAQAEAMQRRLQKQIDSLRNIPGLKKYLPDSQAVLFNNKPQTASSTRPFSDKEFERKKLPAKDSSRTNSIPKKALSLSELLSYLVDLHAQLSKKLPPDAVASAHAIAEKLGNDPVKMEAASMLAWQKGALEESVLLITDAASRTSDDGLLLTNAGAILDMSGLSDKAIPVLRTVVRIEPQNAIALNNLGQAFTQLGMQDSGGYYLDRCLALSPQHPQANNTKGLIALGNGNKAKAQSYFENSIRGGFNIPAYRGLISIDKKYRINGLIRPKVKIPEYFNQFKYQLPRQCSNMNEVTGLKDTYKAFHSSVSMLARKYEKLEDEAVKIFSSTGMQKIQNRALQGKAWMRPFQMLGAIVSNELLLDYLDEQKELERFNKVNRQQYKALEEQYDSEYAKLMQSFDDSEKPECCGEGNTSCCLENEKVCRAVTTLRNKYLPLLAEVNEEWQSRNLQVERKYFDEFVFWNYIGAYDENDFRQHFYGSVKNYLQKLNLLCQTKFFEPCREQDEEEQEKPEQGEVKEMECPFDVEIPLIVGKLEMSCEKFSFKAGEGVLFKYEKNFMTRQSTMSLGIGAEIYKMKGKAAGVEAGVEAGAGMSVFLNFDQIGDVMDGGMQYGVKASAGIDFEHGEKLKIKKEIMNAGVSAGWRFGYNSGINFDEGPLRNLLNPPEKQVNKNVKVYKSN